MSETEETYEYFRQGEDGSIYRHTRLGPWEVLDAEGWRVIHAELSEQDYDNLVKIEEAEAAGLGE